MPKHDDELHDLNEQERRAQYEYDSAKTDEEREAANVKLEKVHKALKEKMAEKGASRRSTGVFF